MRRLYFDHNATCPLRANARAALREAEELPLGNPSSAHAEGRRARRLLEEARERLAAVAGCARDEVVFTSGGTESNALALRAAGDGLVLHAPIEHPSVLRPLAARGGACALPVDGWGRVDPGAIARAAGGGRPALVSVALANHETGVLQDGAALARAAHAAGARVHCDAVQAVGKRTVDVGALEVDLLSLAGHKFHGPLGAGALYVRRRTRLLPQVHGGHQERSRRAGTENLAAVVGLGAAAARAATRLDAHRANDGSALGDRLLEGLLARVPGTRLNGSRDRRLRAIVNLCFTGVDGEAMLHELDLEGVTVSTGSACSAASPGPSHVLLAMGLSPEDAHASVRFSLGEDNTHADIDRILEITPPIAARLRALAGVTSGLRTSA